MDVVWLAEIKWDYLRTRKQQIIRQRPDDVRLFYFEPFVRGRPNRYEGREVDGILAATVPFVKPAPGGPIRAVLAQPWVRGVVNANALRKVRSHLRAAGIDPAGAAVVVSNIYAVDVATRLGASFIAYDCNDAHHAFPGQPDWAVDYYERTCRRANVVTASSRTLAENVARVRGTDEGTALLGNGVDFAHFARVREALGPPDRDGPPRIGYLGAIAPWLDFPLLEVVAEALPDCRLVLVGPQLVGVSDDVARLSRRDNVEIRGAVDYDDVPAAMREFDVGIIPFRYDELTRGVNPNKMYEYLAMGLPVVSTRFSVDVEQYADLVFARDTHDEFIAACRAGVALMRDDASAGRFSGQAGLVAASHDWSETARGFWQLIRDRGGSRG